MDASVETAGVVSGVAPRVAIRSAWPERIAALMEIVGVFVGGTLLSRVIARALGLGAASLRSLPSGTKPDFLALSWSSAAHLILRYGLVLGLAYDVGWWHRRRRLARYGATLAGQPLRAHLRIGVLLFAAAGILPLLVKLLPNVIPMGRAPAHWALTDDLSAPGMWLFLFVGSFGLVPIAEELLMRGYIQSRLSEDFGVPAAILITAAFFTFSHTQYYIASAVGIGMLVSLLIGSIAGGYVRFKTGSVLPGIVGHALGNMPYRGWVAPAVLVLMALLIAVYWKTVYVYAGRIWRDVLTGDAILASLAGFAILAIVLAVVLMAPTLLPIVAGSALLVALALEFREKQS